MKVTMKAARVSKGLRQEDVANKLNINKYTYANYETGKTPIPAKVFMNFCKSVIGCEYDDVEIAK